MSMTMYRVLEARSSQALLSLLAINGKTIVPLREAETGARFVSGKPCRGGAEQGGTRNAIHS